jgi:hypothetical protein
MTPRPCRTPPSSPPPGLPALHLGEQFYRKSELTKVHRSTSVENNVHELTKCGAHV